MHTSSQQALQPTTAQRLAAVALACVFTVGMLLGVDALAVSDVPATQLARAGSSHA